MRLFASLFVLLAGALTTVEAGANAQLTRSLHQPWWPAVAFCAVSLLCLVIVALVAGAPLPGWGAWAAAPWWAWTGGAIGALYAVAMMAFPGRLGAAVFVGLTITAAILASVLLDHLGWVGFERHPAGLGRLLGAVLMVGGLALICVS